MTPEPDQWAEVREQLPETAGHEMPGLGDPTGTRLVPMRRQQAYDHGFADEWNAAPADPAEAVRSVIEPHLPIDVDHPRVVAEAVLAALGCVVERPANTGDHQ